MQLTIVQMRLCKIVLECKIRNCVILNLIHITGRGIENASPSSFSRFNPTANHCPSSPLTSNTSNSSWTFQRALTSLRHTSKTGPSHELVFPSWNGVRYMRWLQLLNISTTALISPQTPYDESSYSRESSLTQINVRYSSPISTRFRVSRTKPCPTFGARNHRRTESGSISVSSM